MYQLYTLSLHDALPIYLPVYTLRKKATGATVRTTDPGRAMISGKWADVGKFKGPILRALAARAPYFHNGAAATLDEVVQFRSEEHTSEVQSLTNLVCRL